MAAPGKFTIDSTTPKIEGMTIAFSSSSPINETKCLFQIRETGNLAWVTIDLPNNAATESPIVIEDLNPVSYDFRVRGVNEVDNPDSYGEWSDVVSDTPLTSAFGAPLVSWDEAGVVTGPLINNTNGSLGSNYNLDTQFGVTSALTNQVRNGRPVWQLGGGSEAGISTSPTPPSPAISQPCTIYVALVPFFLDSNQRWILRGGFGNIEIRAADFGFIFTSGS